MCVFCWETMWERALVLATVAGAHNCMPTWGSLPNPKSSVLAAMYGRTTQCGKPSQTIAPPRQLPAKGPSAPQLQHCMGAGTSA